MGRSSFSSLLFLTLIDASRTGSIRNLTLAAIVDQGMVLRWQDPPFLLIALGLTFALIDCEGNLPCCKRFFKVPGREAQVMDAEYIQSASASHQGSPVLSLPYIGSSDDHDMAGQARRRRHVEIFAGEEIHCMHWTTWHAFSLPTPGTRNEDKKTLAR